MYAIFEAGVFVFLCWAHTIGRYTQFFRADNAFDFYSLPPTHGVVVVGRKSVLPSTNLQTRIIISLSRLTSFL